jgi:hypothetical protein
VPDDGEMVLRFPATSRVLSSPERSDRLWGQWVPESVSAETERPDLEANRSNVKVKKGWSYTSPSFICRYILRLDTFTLTCNVYMLALQVSTGC